MAPLHIPVRDSSMRHGGRATHMHLNPLPMKPVGHYCTLSGVGSVGRIARMLSSKRIRFGNRKLRASAA
jgi:hypothetical protein